MVSKQDYSWGIMDHQISCVKISPPALDGLRLLNRAALPRINETESFWKSCWIVVVSSSPVCLARALPSFWICSTAVGCVHHTFGSACTLPFESLSIFLCSRNHLILVRKKYHEMISISLAVTWTLKLLRCNTYGPIFLVKLLKGHWMTWCDVCLWGWSSVSSTQGNAVMMTVSSHNDPPNLFTT